MSGSSVNTHLIDKESEKHYFIHLQSASPGCSTFKTCRFSQRATVQTWPWILYTLHLGPHDKPLGSTNSWPSLIAVTQWIASATKQTGLWWMGRLRDGHVFSGERLGIDALRGFPQICCWSLAQFPLPTMKGNTPQIEVKCLCFSEGCFKCLRYLTGKAFFLLMPWVMILLD